MMTFSMSHKGAVSGQRLHLEGVQPGATDLTVLEGGDQSFLIHHFAPGHVHQESGGLHGFELLRAHHVEGLIVQLDAQHHVVAPGQEVGELVPVLRAEDLIRVLLLAPAAVPAQNGHVVYLGQPGHLHAVLAQADDAQGVAKDAHLLGVPRFAAHLWFCWALNSMGSS